MTSTADPAERASSAVVLFRNGLDNLIVQSAHGIDGAGLYCWGKHAYRVSGIAMADGIGYLRRPGQCPAEMAQPDHAHLRRRRACLLHQRGQCVRIKIILERGGPTVRSGLVGFVEHRGRLRVGNLLERVLQTGSERPQRIDQLTSLVRRAEVGELELGDVPATQWLGSSRWRARPDRHR